MSNEVVLSYVPSQYRSDIPTLWTYIFCQICVLIVLWFSTVKRSSYVTWIGCEIWRREKEAVVEQETECRRNVPQGETEPEHVDTSGTINRPRLWNWEGILRECFPS